MEVEIKYFIISIYDHYIGISKRKVQDFLNRQESYQLRRRVPQKKQQFSIIPRDINHYWLMDLIDLHKYRSSNTHSYILNIIDIFSKYLFSYPLKNKEAKDVYNVLSKLFKEGFVPNILQSDNGLEFKNTIIANLCKKYHVKQVFSKSYSSNAQGQVERVNGTIRSELEKFMVGY